MTDPHEDLVAAVAYSAVQKTAKLTITAHGHVALNCEEIARAVVALIAERTKDATPEMIAAVMPGRSENAARTVYNKMHRESALWPKDKP